jgi:hypothetical protein
VRRNHAKAMKAVEIDFHEYLEFKKKNESKFKEEEDSQEKEAIFTLEKGVEDKDPVIAYLKEKMKTLK